MTSKTVVMTLEQVKTEEIKFGEEGVNKYGDKYQVLNYGGEELYIKVNGTLPFGVYNDNIHVNINDNDMLHFDLLDEYFDSIYADWRPITKHHDGYPAHLECSSIGCVFYDKMGKAIPRPLTETTVGAEVTVLIHLNNIRHGDGYTTLKPRAKQLKIKRTDRLSSACLI